MWGNGKDGAEAEGGWGKARDGGGHQLEVVGDGRGSCSRGIGISCAGGWTGGIGDGARWALLARQCSGVWGKGEFRGSFSLVSRPSQSLLGLRYGGCG